LRTRLRRVALFGTLLAVAALVIGHPFPPLWSNGGGPAVHYQPVPWPAEPANPANCGDSCGDWKPYTRFGNSINDARVQDASNGGTAPQNYVNVSSSCSDKAKPSIYYHLYKDALDPAKDVLMFRWRVEQAAHNYATGPSAGNYSSSNPWSSALWTVLFDIDGSGYRSLAAHLNGSSGSPAEAIDSLAGIWGETPTQSLDYLNDPKVHRVGHNPTAVIGATGKILNFQDSQTPSETWPDGASATSWDYGMTRAKKVSASPCTEYFIDYQIPVAMLDATAVGGPKITRATPISMLFCTANSLTNPFQKDCAVQRTWAADGTRPAPFGDYLSFEKDEPYRQPIVSSVAAQAPASCPGPHKLTAKVQDALTVVNGSVGTSIKAVDFYYWHDRDGDGAASVADTGSAWTRITPAAALTPQTLNTWTATWNASALSKGRYLIGVQAVDDATAVDDGMLAGSVDNRTFSYFSGDAENRLYTSGVWQPGQQSQFLAHSPVQSPSNAEDWYGNPSATGNQIALVGTAINACGVAPTLALDAAPSSVAAGATVAFTVTLSNPSSSPSAVSVDTIDVQLPGGFSYVNGTSSGATSANPSANGQSLTWQLASPVNVTAGASLALSFNATAGTAAGTYNATASAITSYGDVSSAPAAIVVDAARVSLTSTPSTYSVPADGSTPLTFTLRYGNDSALIVTNAGVAAVVPAGAAYVSCSGGTSCSESGGTVTFALGDLSASSTGSVTYTLNVPNSWATTSLTSSATLSATAPDSSPVNAAASSTVAVTGLAGATAPALRLSKTANVVTTAPGGTVTFTLSYENYGTAAASAVVLTDTLPAGFSYSSCSNSCSQSAGVVTWDIGTLGAGANGTRTVTATAATPFTAANPAVNNASVTWSGGTPVTANASVGVTGLACSVYYFRNTTANVGFDSTQRIASTLPAPVPADAGTGITATAPVSGSAFLEVLRFYQDPQTQNDVPFNGNITSNVYIDRANGPGLDIRTTVYDYNSTTGGRTQLAQNTTLFNGSTKGLLSFAVSPSGTLLKGHRLLWVYEARSSHNSQTVQVQVQLGGTVTNAISGGTTFANSNAQYCVTPPASLTLSNSVDTPSIAENTTPTLKYTLRYANTGGAQATNVSLVGALPSGFTNCQYSTNDSTWNACSSAGAATPSHTFSIASLAGGGSGTVYVRGAVPANTAGPATLTSTSTLASDQTVAITAIATTQVTGTTNSGTAALSLDLGSNRSVAAPGQSVTYTATVVNIGDGSASNVVVSNTLPVNAYYSYVGCTGGCVNDAGTLTWPTIGTLAAGASQTYTYTMIVGTNGLPAGTTTITDDLGATGAGGLTATSSSVSVSLNGNPSLQAEYGAGPANGLRPADQVTYTLAIDNAGAAAAEGVKVSATVPVHTRFTSSALGSYDPSDNRVTFDVGALGSGAGTSVSFVVTVDTPLDSGTTALISTATLSAGNAVQQSLVATATATAEPLLFISHIAPASVPLPSAVLTAAANGTVLFVDRSDRFSLGQLVQVGNDVAAIVAIGSGTISVDTPVSAASGTPVYASLTLTIAYRNDGDADGTGVTIREALPSGLVYYDADPSAFSSPIRGNSGDVDWSIGTVNAGGGGTLRVIAFPGGQTGLFTSTATIQAANATTQTADALTAIGGLSVAKTTTTPVLSAGGEAEYTIATSNSLSQSVQVDVTDVLPEGFTYQDGSASVGGMSLEPTFDADDSAHARPIWGGVVVPSLGTLVITFKADVSAATGAAAYQNELQVAAPGNVAVLSFDPLSTTREDVTVLAADEGVLNGYVFRRYVSGNTGFDPASDLPLAAVRVEIHKQAYDCDTGADCYVAYTDSAGLFERVVPAGDWIVSVVAASGDLDPSWTQIAGVNDDTVSVPAQGSVTDHNGYRAVGAMHVVTATAGSGGAINPGSDSVEEGDTTSFSVTPAGGYLIDTVDGCGGTLAGNTFTTAPITSACSVTATFAQQTHTVTASAGSGGTIDPASANVAHGTPTAFTVNPNLGHSIASVTGCGGTLTGPTTYTTGQVTGSCAVAATFSANSYLVSTNAGTGGSIGPASDTVSFGATPSFTVTPSAGYDIANVSGCGGALAGNTYTTAPIAAACTINATFSVSNHAISTLAGVGGSIAPASASVSDGNTATFTVTPANGYSIAAVSGCGVGGPVGNAYTTAPVTAACTISATFAALSYTITASAGPGGSITPPSTSVSHGATTSFAVTPDAGYTIGTVSGCPGLLTGNTFTTQPITQACAVSATFTSSAPTIETPPPARINARSLFTAVPQSLAPLAADGSGAPLSVTLVGGPLQLLPGRHTITWQAEDAFGQTVSVDQQLDVWPIVSLSQDLVLDYGTSGTFDVLLNGAAPVYPYTVAFTVGGDGGFGSKHTLASGSVTFESGTEAQVSFDTLPQPDSPLDHHLEVTLDAAENRGERSKLDIVLRAVNFAPQVSIVAIQADRTGTLIAKDDGTVTLRATVTDPNAADSHTLQWSYPSSAPVSISSDGFELSFDPRQLAASLPNFAVVATDSGHPSLKGQASSVLALRDSAPVLGSGDSNGNGVPDSVEGWGDSGNGIPAYLNRITARNVLPENSPVVDRYLIESESGIRLRVGAAAQIDGDGGARLGNATIPARISADEFDNVGGYFSFEAHELASPGNKVRFIVPQRAPIPSDPRYRLWDQDTVRWMDFVEDATNTIESAPGAPGVCPAADSDAYVRGLTPGHLCVRLTIADGGSNDLDRQMNKSVMSTGGVGGRIEVVVTGTSSGSGGGGGGAMTGGWTMLFGLIALFRAGRRRIVPAMAAMILLPLAAVAQDHRTDDVDSRRGWLLGANALFVAGSVDATEMDARIARQGYRTQTELSGQQRLGAMVSAGYRRHHLGLEAAYVDLGKMTTRVRGTNPITDDYLLAISRSHPQSGSGPQFSVLGYLPFGERFEVFGRAGAFYWRSNMSAEGRSRYRDVDHRAFDPALGLGLNYRMTDRWTAAGQWTAYRLAGERVSALSVGVTYAFSRRR
jgi:uncharacterized repeat protein (TIGR01451 family)